MVISKCAKNMLLMQINGQHQSQACGHLLGEGGWMWSRKNTEVSFVFVKYSFLSRELVVWVSPFLHT